MAVFNSPLDDKGQAAKLVKLYTDTAKSITSKMTSMGPGTLAQRNQVLAQINKELAALGVDTGKWIQENIPLQYRAGMQAAIEGLKATQKATPFYRGTGNMLTPPGNDLFGKGYYITPDKAIAKEFGDKVETVYLNLWDPNVMLRINSQEELDKLFKDAVKAYPNLSAQEAIPKFAANQGYKAIVGTDNLDTLAGINVLDKTLISDTPALATEALFTQIDRESVKAMVDDTSRSFADALTTVGRTVKNIQADAFQKEIKARLAEGQISGETRKQIAADIAQKIQDEGITALVDKGGRTWTLERYADMLTNTKLAEARNTGLANKMMQEGNDLVEVSSNGSTHPVCEEYEGEILSISGESDQYDSLDDAEAAGLFHPNCQHTVNAVEPDLASQTYGWNVDTQSYEQGVGLDESGD